MPLEIEYNFGDEKIIDLPYYSQTPDCGYTLTFTYSVDGVENPTLEWFTF